MSDKAIYEVINELALRDIIWEKSCDLDTIAQNYAVVKQLQSSSWFALFPLGVERKYINLLDRIFFEDDKLEYIISQFSFDKILLKFMLEEVFFKKCDITFDKWNIFIDNLKNSTLTKYEVFYPWPNWMIFCRPPYQIGPVTFYDKKALIQENKQIKDAFANKEFVQDFKNVNQIIGIICDTVDDESNTANCIAENLYFRIKNLFYSLLPAVRQSPMPTRHASSINNIVLTNKRSCITPTPPHIDPFCQITCIEMVPLMIFTICKNIKEMNVFEKRFLTAITLIGRGRSSNEKFENFLLCSSGIEAIVKSGKTNLTEQFKKHSAILIADSKEDQSYISEEMGLLYDVRSDIAHGKKLNITDDNLYKLHIRSLQLVISYFYAFQKMTRIEEFHQYIVDNNRMN